MAFERGSELGRVHKLRMVWIARPKNMMGGLERPRAKSVAREVEVRWSGQPWRRGPGEDMWEEVWEEAQSSERRIW